MLGARDRAHNDFVKLKVLGDDRTANNIIPYLVENIETDIHNPTRIYTDGFPVYE